MENDIIVLDDTALEEAGWKSEILEEFLGWFEVHCFFNPNYPDVFINKRYDNKKPGYEIYAFEERTLLNDKTIYTQNEFKKHLETTLSKYKKTTN